MGTGESLLSDPGCELQQARGKEEIPSAKIIEGTETKALTSAVPV